MDDATLASDYHFLEDALQGVERAKRSVEGGGNNALHNNKRPRHHHPREETEEETATPHSMLQQQMEQFEISDNKNDPAIANNTDDNNAKEVKSSHITDNISNKKSMRKSTGLPSNNNAVHQLGPKWRNFKQQANLRGTNLLLMPSGMQRRKANTSHIKKNVLYWKIDVRLHAFSASASISDTTMDQEISAQSVPQQPTVHSVKVCEEAVLCKELRAKLDAWRSLPSTSHTRNHSDGNNDSGSATAASKEKNEPEKIHWLLQKLPSPSNRHSYIEIVDEEATLQSILKGMTVIEYPTIEGVPTSRLGEFPRAIEELVPIM